MTAFTVVPSRSGLGEHADGWPGAAASFASALAACCTNLARINPHNVLLLAPCSYCAVRTFNQRTVLDMFAARITAVSLSGYMFFGRWAAGTRALAPKIA